MIQLTPSTLHQGARKQLRRWTREIESTPSFDDQVRWAKAKFPTRNRPTNKTFQRVRAALYAMCNDTHRCVYCEDNRADEVEHMRPKDIFPEHCFAWANYVYACGGCNGGKNNKFAVVDSLGVEHDVTPPRRQRGAPPVLRTPPVAGTALLIDPRVEDPMDYLGLDLDRGGFAPLPGLASAKHRRAEYTLDVLGMNQRRLPKARVKALGTFTARLEQYLHWKARPATTQPDLDRLIKELVELNHITVWHEMRRQRAHYPALNALFQAAPEALTW